jgi:hypothetical protein
MQKNSVFIHSVPDGILGAWWTESSARPMRAMWHDYRSFSSYVKAVSDGSNWDNKKNGMYCTGDLKMMPPNTAVY